MSGIVPATEPQAQGQHTCALRNAQMNSCHGRFLKANGSGSGVLTPCGDMLQCHAATVRLQGGFAALIVPRVKPRTVPHVPSDQP